MYSPSQKPSSFKYFLISVVWLVTLDSTVAQFGADVTELDTILFGDETVFPSWTKWSSWSMCDATCGGTGTQERYKRCLQRRHGSNKCHRREVMESRPCKQSYCVEEYAKCETTGIITDASGISLSGVEVGLDQFGKTLTLTNENGFFGLDGICADSGFGHLVARKINYVTTKIPIRRNATGYSTALVKLLREVKPIIYQNPENKVRLAGDSVKFCCSARGNHRDHIYYWYHNGTLIDPASYSRDPRTLEKRNLNLEDAGSYKCKVKSTVSFKPTSQGSNTAYLTVAASEESTCPEEPTKMLIAVPRECAEDKRTVLKPNNKTYLDIGTCTNAICPLTHSGDGCGDFKNVTSCCGSVEREEVVLNCGGFTLPAQRTVRCRCRKCVKPVFKVRGRAYASDSGDPLRYGFVRRAGKQVGTTAYNGTFSLDVHVGTKQLVLTFEDRFGKLMSTTKILSFQENGGITYHEIKMKRKAPLKTFASHERSVTDLNGVVGQEAVAKVLTAPGSFYKKDGRAYTGEVKASVTFVDPRNSSYEESPADLSFMDNNGDSSPLQTVGMFEMDFRDNNLNELDIAKAKVVLDKNQFISPAYAEKMKLWSLNPENGMWEEEESFQEMYIEDDEVKPGPKRRKREIRTFLVGNLELRERRLYNLNVPVENRCWMKVRAYRSPDFNPDEQLEEVEVTAINMDPSTGFRGNPEAWGQFYTDLTTKEGACLRVLCHSDKANVYKATVVAKFGNSEELEAAPSGFPLEPEVVGIEKDILKTLEYRRSDHSLATGKRTSFQTNLPKPKPDSGLTGPIYPAENYTECARAPVTHNHFRFYRTEDFLYEYNTVYMDEHNCITWTPNYLNWWPSHIVYAACYIKVHIDSFSRTVVRVKSYGGTHPETIGKLYGIRDDRSVIEQSNDNKFSTSSAACIEFKCSGLLYDEELQDRTLVSVVPQGECQLRGVNEMLTQYLTKNPPAVQEESTAEFQMYAPEDCLDHNYGIYVGVDDDPLVSKQRALGYCYAGSSDVTSRVMQAKKGVAVYFDCVDRNLEEVEEA